MGPLPPLVERRNGAPPQNGTQLRPPAGTLKPDLTSTLAADVFWAVAGPETYEALVVRRGWTPEAFEAWIAEALADLLLT